MPSLIETNVFLFIFVSYCVLIVGTFIPVLQAIRQKVQLHDGGKGFESSTHFSKKEIDVLKQHYSRMQGTLGYWKNMSEKYRRFHYYCMLWTIPSAVLVPILTQFVDTQNPYARWTATAMSAFTAILISFHKALNTEDNFKAFRHGESEFYDLYRRFLDRPWEFGSNFQQQSGNYFREVESIRRYTRNAETNNLATIERRRPESIRSQTLPAEGKTDQPATGNK